MAVALSQAARIQKCMPRCSNTNNPPSIDSLPRNQPAIVRILPNRKLRARRTPRLHYFLVGPLPRIHPKKQIDNQRLHNRICHHSLTSNAPASKSAATFDRHADSRSLLRASRRIRRRLSPGAPASCASAGNLSDGTDPAPKPPPFPSGDIRACPAPTPTHPHDRSRQQTPHLQLIMRAVS